MDVKLFRFLAILGLFGLLAVWLPTDVEAQAPSNDLLENAAGIGELPYYSGDIWMGEATSAGDPTDCLGGPGIWWSYTPSSPMQIRVNPYGYPEPWVAVYQSDGGALSLLGCGTDYPMLLLDVEAGVTYFFLVGSLNEGWSDYVNLSVSEVIPPPVCTVVFEKNGNVNRLTGGATVFGTVTCTKDATVYGTAILSQKLDKYTVVAVTSYLMNPEGGNAFYVDAGVTTPFAIFFQAGPGKTPNEVTPYTTGKAAIDMSWEALKWGTVGSVGSASSVIQLRNR